MFASVQQWLNGALQEASSGMGSMKDADRRHGYGEGGIGIDLD